MLNTKISEEMSNNHLDDGIAKLYEKTLEFPERENKSLENQGF